MSLLQRVLAFALCLLALEPFAAAQCPLPDGLDGGPCCTVAPLDLPKFPNFSQDMLGICWHDCDIEQVQTCQARWTTVPILAVPPPCGFRLVNLELLDALGVKWKGRVRLLYSRTWLETAPGGVGLQVWRFLVNGDLIPRSGLPVPCPVPPCVTAFGGRVRFTGYIDYAQDCITEAWQFAWMLNHSCDLIDHHPGFPRAGAFHPDRAYTFVGPAAGFVPAPLLPFEGTVGSAFEDIRRIDYPPPGVVGPILCEYEERMTYSLNPFQQLCLCMAGPPQYSIASMSLNGVCGTSVFTPGGPFLPGFISMGIGTWTVPATFPGVERLRWNTGGYDYIDPCTGTTRHEVFFGVTTMDGYPATQLLTPGPAGPLPPVFIDQSNSLTNAGVTVMNVPYISDHILNLNH